MEIRASTESRQLNVVRARKGTVLTAWQHDVLREVAGLERLTPNALLEPVESLVDRFADWMEDHPDRAANLRAAAETHTLQRFRHGFTIDAIVREYARLRQALLIELDNVRLGLQLDHAIDMAVAHATHYYVLHREELRERFIGVLAHDLRTPLASVTMAAEMLLVAERTAHERSLLERVLEASDRMQRMVNDVLTWARASLSEGFPVAAEPTDIATILDLVIEETRLVHGEHAVTVALAGDLRGQFDRDRVHQAITNLVRNAIEHGGGSAHVEASEIDNGQTILLVVRNQGGLQAASASDITDPFRRRKRPTNARGLGLYIVDQIARGHGATLDMTAMGEDTAITIRWPTRRSVVHVLEQPTL